MELSYASSLKVLNDSNMDYVITNIKPESSETPKEYCLRVFKTTSPDQLSIWSMVWTLIYHFGNKLDLNFIDVSKCYALNNLFQDMDFQGDISKWDTSNVRGMDSIFCGSTFNGDISNWDVSHVKDMYRAFQSSKFNGDLSKWNTINVKNFKFCFEKSAFNGDLSNWIIRQDAKTEDMFRNSPLEAKYGRNAENLVVTKLTDLRKQYDNGQLPVDPFGI